jgi:dolichol-phosphate mannosyltransferase
MQSRAVRSDGTALASTTCSVTVWQTEHLRQSGGGGALTLLNDVGTHDPAASSGGDRHFDTSWPADEIELTIVVPTRNESENVGALLARLDRVAPSVRAEVLFVDDSDDGTPEAIAVAAAETRRAVRVVHRTAGDRNGGLSGAVVEGIRASKGDWVCVIDGDLQHPPEVIEQMMLDARSGAHEVIVASRYSGAGSSTGFGALRSTVSRSSNSFARLLFPRPLRSVNDPMSGFFLVRRRSIDLSLLRPQGFKILLEILVSHTWLRTGEVPFDFGTRHAGESKASLQQGMIYLAQLGRLRVSGRIGNFGRFGVVGLSGLLVNTLTFALLANVGRLNYLLAAIVATQVSTLSNYLLTERWVFAHRSGSGGLFRASLYFAMNNLTLILRVPLLIVLVAGIGLSGVIANVFSLVALTAARFMVADSLIWRDRSQEHDQHRYDVHGLVSVVSEVALPELEAFRTDLVIAEPTINVRIGRLSGRQSNLVAALTHRTRHIRYDEGLGPAGFAVDISTAGGQVDVVASHLLRFSPHVLYTNVVEPILRWSFVPRGYALVHGACISVGDDAYLLTARTDTGKTTTILKILDRSACGFLSDDLTLIDASGRVLTYPKPLTISRHTAAAVRTPLLTLGERIRLVYQSRIHSRSGRRFAMLVARLRLPAATINALVQMLVPPPKYHIGRLIPNVTLKREARLTRLIVIERGGQGSVELSQEEALETLLANCEDAYGFPPYSTIAPFLYRRATRDLRLAERKIVASALAPIPALTLRSESMDWWERLRLLMGLESESEPVAAEEGIAAAVSVA